MQNNSIIIQDPSLAANIAVWCHGHLSSEEWNIECTRLFPTIYKFTIDSDVNTVMAILNS